MPAHKFLRLPKHWSVTHAVLEKGITTAFLEEFNADGFDIEISRKRLTDGISLARYHGIDEHPNDLSHQLAYILFLKNKSGAWYSRLCDTDHCALEKSLPGEGSLTLNLIFKPYAPKSSAHPGVPGKLRVLNP